MMKAVFIGSVDFSRPLLEVVMKHSAFEIVGVVTKEKSTFNADFLNLSKSYPAGKYPTFYYANNADEMERWILERKPDVVFCLGWSHLLPESLLRRVPQGVVGYHPALLPQNRGRHPIVWALVLGLSKTGSSFFKMDGGADTGELLSQEEVAISEKDDASDLYERLKSVARRQLQLICDQMGNGTLKSKPQSQENSNSWRKRGAADGLIDWRMSARSIYNLVRGLSRPYVGADFTKGQSSYKIWKSEWIADAGAFQNREPGQIVKVQEGLPVIKCGEGLLKITEHNCSEAFVAGEYL